jgi:hypothetical protein
MLHELDGGAGSRVWVISLWSFTVPMPAKYIPVHVHPTGSETMEGTQLKIGPGKITIRRKDVEEMPIKIRSRLSKGLK